MKENIRIYTLAIICFMISAALFVFGFATLIGTKFGGYLGDHVGIKKSLIGSMGNKSDSTG